MFSSDSNARYTAHWLSENDCYHIKNADKISSIVNNKSWHTLWIRNDGRSALREEKISQCNGTPILPRKCQSTVRGFLTVHNNNNDITTCI